MLIAVATEKGGVGKTTIATNLAALRVGHRRTVKLIDTDRQESAYTWGMLRVESDIAPTIRLSKLTGNIFSELTAERESIDTVIVDAGGRDSAELRSAIAACDVLVMPIKPGQFDTWSLGKMAQLVQAARSTGRTFRAVAVLNGVSANPQSKEASEMRAVLREMSDYFSTFDGAIVDRVAFRNAAREGRGVTELDRGMFDQKAADELSQLYAEVFRD
jgi:chromosome partitioning protein